MKKFIKERWYLHLICGALIITPLIWLLIKYDPSFDIGKFGQAVIAWFFGWILGVCWEWYNGKFHEAPFDWWDVAFTSIGAIIGTVLICNL